MKAKKKILFVYDSMMIGGTTSAILALLEEIKREYDVSLLLYENGGAFFDQIPTGVRILDEARTASFFSSSFRKKT